MTLQKIYKLKNKVSRNQHMESNQKHICFFNRTALQFQSISRLARIYVISLN